MSSSTVETLVYCFLICHVSQFDLGRDFKVLIEQTYSQIICKSICNSFARTTLAGYNYRPIADNDKFTFLRRRKLNYPLQPFALILNRFARSVNQGRDDATGFVPETRLTAQHANCTMQIGIRVQPLLYGQYCCAMILLFPRITG